MTNYTEQQRAIFDWARNDTGHAIVQARAGCGKTTTLLGLCEAILETQPKASVTIMAYNKAIQTEIAEKLIKRADKIDEENTGNAEYLMRMSQGLRKVRAKTLHGAGFGEWRYANRSVTLDEHKMELIIRSNNRPEASLYEQNILRLVSLAKQYAFGYLRPIDDRQGWYDLIEHFDINGFDDGRDLDTCVDLAQWALRESLDRDRSIIDFDDMILAPLVHKCRTFPLDWVLIDEAQDLSPARRSLAIMLAGRKGRMVFVGDDRQALYGFAGADSDSIEQIRKTTNAQIFPLNVTWRCPKAVVKVAQEIVPDITAANEAPEGIVRCVDGLFKPTEDAAGEYVSELLNTDVILCRTNAPLVETAFALIRRGIACKVEGRDIGKNLLALIQRWKVKSIDAFLNKLQTWEEREISKAKAKGNENKSRSASDKADTLRVIAQKAQADGRTDVKAMEEIIQSLFADNVTNLLTLCSVHKSKGREWRRVMIIHPELLPAPWARQEWEKKQEANARYVAITRAMEELIWVGG